VGEHLDEEVGPLRQSEVGADTPRAELDRRRLVETMERAIGALADVDVPGWETSESTRAWVRAQRRVDEDPDDLGAERERRGARRARHRTIASDPRTPPASRRRTPYPAATGAGLRTGVTQSA
jgi:hypothetical protein